MRNEYIPRPAIIKSIKIETPDTKTYRVIFKDKIFARHFNYKPGQFIQVSILGIGECPISIASSPTQGRFLEFTVRAAGRLTRLIHQLNAGDRIYIRGPYGNPFPLNRAKNKDLYFIAGGIGLPPLRGVIVSALKKRANFGKIRILYGAKTPDELCFRDELDSWNRAPDTEVLLTVDKPDKNWKGNVGVVTTLWNKTNMNNSSGIAFVCGPPIMFKFVVDKLLASGFKDKNIYLTLERYMKCGIGKCGHCNIGEKFVCTDGPVFDYHSIKELPVKERVIF